MNADALATALALHRAHARLQLKLDDALGTLHGLSWDDFVLLATLAEAQPQGLSLSALVAPLGIPPSGVLRRVAPLEKLGLVERSTARLVMLRPAGRRLWQEACETAADICAGALPPAVQVP